MHLKRYFKKFKTYYTIKKKNRLVDKLYLIALKNTKNNL